jgi:23S rRNA pseudouridine1911/1915/1917 synthase
MSLVKIRLHTGRSHQIRVHFSHAGFPLVGDRKYGKKPWSELCERPLLHAFALKFPYEGKNYAYQTTPPKDFLEFLKKVGGFQDFLNL